MRKPDRAGRASLDAPAPQVTVIDDLFPPPLIGAAYGALRHLVIPAGYLYLPWRAIRARPVADHLADYLPPPAARFIELVLTDLTGRIPAAVMRRTHGFEVWLGMTARSGRDAYLHVDNDEKLRRTSKVLVNPLLGAILHLGPSTGMSGGETMFDLGGLARRKRDLFSFRPWPEILANSVAPMVVPRRAGRLILFSGTLPHAVAPIGRISPRRPRVALLVNAWHQRLASVPRGICAIPAGDFRQLAGGGPAAGK